MSRQFTAFLRLLAFRIFSNPQTTRQAVIPGIIAILALFGKQISPDKISPVLDLLAVVAGAGAGYKLLSADGEKRGTGA